MLIQIIDCRVIIFKFIGRIIGSRNMPQNQPLPSPSGLLPTAMDIANIPGIHAIQIFHEPNTGMEEVIVGAVGVLQFEVLEYRLKNEYNIDIRRRDLSYSYIRWITSEGTDPTALNLASDTKWVQDFRGHNLLIFNNEWSIRWAEQKNPGLTLAEFSTNQDDEA